MAKGFNTYSPKLVDELCARISSGNSSMAKICAADDMPAVQVVYRWLVKYPEFEAKFTQAKANQMDVLAEDMLDIADNSTKDTFKVDRLRIDTRKWLASKLKAKKYGDATQLRYADADGGKLDVQSVLATLSNTGGLPTDD